MPEPTDYCDKNLVDSTNTLEITKSAKYMTALSSKVSHFKFTNRFLERYVQRSDEHV